MKCVVRNFAIGVVKRLISKGVIVDMRQKQNDEIVFGRKLLRQQRLKSNVFTAILGKIVEHTKTYMKSSRL